MYVSEIYTKAPADFETPLQERVYHCLAELGIKFKRVNTEKVITMEDCADIEKKLAMKMVKTLFLCDRKKEHFYLFITVGTKPFRAADFSHALGVSRVSFAPAAHMKFLLGTEIGAATVFSALLPTARSIRFVVDADILAEPWYGCSDGTVTGYMKIRTEDIFNVFLPHTGHHFEVIEV